MLPLGKDMQNVLEEEEEAVRRDLELVADISLGAKPSFSFTSSTWISP